MGDGTSTKLLTKSFTFAIDFQMWIHIIECVTADEISFCKLCIHFNMLIFVRNILTLISDSFLNNIKKCKEPIKKILTQCVSIPAKENADDDPSQFSHEILT